MVALLPELKILVMSLLCERWKGCTKPELSCVQLAVVYINIILFLRDYLQYESSLLLFLSHTVVFKGPHHPLGNLFGVSI